MRFRIMPNYTFYVLEPDGYLVSGTVVNCLDDAAALARANYRGPVAMVALEPLIKDAKLTRQIDVPPGPLGRTTCAIPGGARSD